MLPDQNFLVFVVVALLLVLLIIAWWPQCWRCPRCGHRMAEDHSCHGVVTYLCNYCGASFDRLRG